MKKKEKLSLRALSDEELTKHIRILESEIAKELVDRSTKQIKNVRLIRTKRREIAVAKTLLSIRRI